MSNCCTVHFNLNPACFTTFYHGTICWPYYNLQVFAIEFITFATDFVSFAVKLVTFTAEFVPFVIYFVCFAIEFVTFALEFVTFAQEFVVRDKIGSCSKHENNM